MKKFTLYLILVLFSFNLFASERPSMFSLIGGAIILLAVLIQFYTLLKKSEKTISH